MPRSLTALRTLPMSRSKANSGACTPITTRPWSWYFAAQALTYGKLRRQLMQEYVQKSTSTTLPFRLAAVSGGEFNHCTAPSSGGSGPSDGRTAGAETVAAAIMAPLLAGLGLNLSSSDCSSEVVPLFDT